MDNEINSVLNMEHVVFDKIEFVRRGFKQNAIAPSLQLEVQTGFSPEIEKHRVTLVLKVEKEKEYSIEIILTGYFSVRSNDTSEEIVNALIQQNAVAILMPYLRSELTILTAQPETDSIVLPVLNVVEMMQNDHGDR